MKRFLTTKLAVLFLVSALSAPALAASSLGESIPDSQGGKGVFLSAGAGLAFYNGNTGWGFNVGAITPVLMDGLYVGADLGMTFWSYSTAGLGGPLSSNSSSGIALLPTAIYRFDIADWKGVAPYLGLSVGPNIFRNTVGGNSSTSVLLQAMVRPGVFFELGKSVSLQTEVKFGWLGGNFLLNPHVSAAFLL